MPNRNRRSFPLLPSILRAAALCAATLSGTAGIAQQQPAAPRRIQDCLPASTCLTVGFGGLDECTAALHGHAAGQAVVEFLQRVPPATFETHVGRELDRAVEHVRAVLGAADLSPATLRALLQRPMAIGVGRLTIRGMGPSVALVVDEGQVGAEIDALVDRAADGLAGMGFELAAATVGDTACRVLRSPFGPPVLFAHHAGTFVATNSEGYLREILAVAGSRGEALVRNSSLASQRQQLGGPPLVEVHLHTAPLAGVVRPFLPYEADAIGAALGVEGLDGVYAGIAPIDGGTVETLDIALRGPAAGLLKAAFAGPADFGAAAMCSADAVAFATLHCDLPATFAGIEALLTQMPDVAQQQLQRQWRRAQTRFERQTGSTSAQVQQLMRSLGGSVSAAVTLAKGTPLPELLLVVPVKDRAVVGQWLERLEAMAAERGVEWKTRTMDGTEVRYFELPARGAPLVVTPALVLLDDYLLIGSQPRVLGDALKTRADRDSSLAATADFAAVASANPGASALLHLRQGRALELGWRVLDTMVLNPLDAMQDEVGFGRDALPDQEQLVRAMGSTTLCATVDDRGVRCTARGNLGVGGLLVGAATLVDELLQRASGKVY